MELSRRDALAALAAGGGTYLGAHTANIAKQLPQNRNPQSDSRSRSLADNHQKTIIAIAETIYPSTVSNIEPFVTTYLSDRLQDDTYTKNLERTIDKLNELSQAWHDHPFYALEPATQDTMLREIGADTAEATPTGSPGNQVRYYLINDLLYALYASPTGGRLVGIENPQGYPGGLESYQRGPNNDK